MATNEDDFLERLDRMLMPESGAHMAGLVGASMLPGVGTAIDIADIGFGIRNRDPLRVGQGLVGLALPFVSGRTLRGGKKLSNALVEDSENLDLFQADRGFPGDPSMAKKSGIEDYSRGEGSIRPEQLEGWIGEADIDPDFALQPEGFLAEQRRLSGVPGQGEFDSSLLLEAQKRVLKAIRFAEQYPDSGHPSTAAIQGLNELGLTPDAIHRVLRSFPEMSDVPRSEVDSALNRITEMEETLQAGRGIAGLPRKLQLEMFPSAPVLRTGTVDPRTGKGLEGVVGLRSSKGTAPLTVQAGKMSGETYNRTIRTPMRTELLDRPINARLGAVLRVLDRRMGYDDVEDPIRVIRERSAGVHDLSPRVSRGPKDPPTGGTGTIQRTELDEAKALGGRGIRSVSESDFDEMLEGSLYSDPRIDPLGFGGSLQEPGISTGRGTVESMDITDIMNEVIRSGGELFEEGFGHLKGSDLSGTVLDTIGHALRYRPRYVRKVMDDTSTGKAPGRKRFISQQLEFYAPKRRVWDEAKGRYKEVDIPIIPKKTGKRWKEQAKKIRARRAFLRKTPDPEATAVSPAEQRRAQRIAETAARAAEEASPELAEHQRQLRKLRERWKEQARKIRARRASPRKTPHEASPEFAERQRELRKLIRDFQGAAERAPSEEARESIMSFVQRTLVPQLRQVGPPVAPILSPEAVAGARRAAAGAEEIVDVLDEGWRSGPHRKSMGPARLARLQQVRRNEEAARRARQAELDAGYTRPTTLGWDGKVYDLERYIKEGAVPSAEAVPAYGWLDEFDRRMFIEDNPDWRELQSATAPELAREATKARKQIKQIEADFGESLDEVVGPPPAVEDEFVRLQRRLSVIETMLEATGAYDYEALYDAGGGAQLSFLEDLAKRAGGGTSRGKRERQ